MKKYVIRTGVGEAFNAASKARRDAEAIAREAGYEVFEFHGKRTGDGSLRAAAHLALDGWQNWRRLLKTAEPGDLVLVLYPHYPVKSAFLMKQMISAGQRKGVRFIALVHDLDSLRGLFGRAAEYSDGQVLPRFDAVICHNEKMKAALKEKGLPPERMVSLDVFDYLSSQTPAPHDRKDGIAVAGNLSPEKSGYLLSWLSSEEGFSSEEELSSAEELPIHLYGKGLEGERLPKRVCLHGPVSPEELPETLCGGFGLVWDGPSAKGCDGKSGNYLRWNNPHKLSLYLASGLPVILPYEYAGDGYVVGIINSYVNSDTEQHCNIRRITSRVYNDMLSDGLFAEGTEFQDPRTRTVMVESAQPAVDEPVVTALPSTLQTPAPEDTWLCPNCGQTGNFGNFCFNCGAAKPADDANAEWTCSECGQAGNTGNFCFNCGTPRPGEGEPAAEP